MSRPLLQRVCGLDSKGPVPSPLGLPPAVFRVSTRAVYDFSLKGGDQSAFAVASTEFQDQREVVAPWSSSDYEMAASRPAGHAVAASI